MTIGEELRAKLDAIDSSHQDVAMEWLSRWEKQGGKSFSTDTVPSRLSDLLADRVKGLRFFFTDRVRAGLLFDVLGLGDVECKRLLELADEMLSNGGKRPPRLILDISMWEGNREEIDRVFQAIEKRFLDSQQIRPIALVLTDDQYRHLPRTWDDLGDDLDVHRVADADSAENTVKDIASAQGILLSSRRLVPYSRWIAAEFDGTDLRLDPENAVEQLVNRGALAELPQVEHNLASITDSVTDTPLPKDAVEQRRLMHNLSTDDGAEALNEPAEVRMGWARRLGVEASSTERERVEAEIADLSRSLPLEVTERTAKQLDRLLGDVHHEPVPEQILRVADEIHGVNIELPEHPRISVHKVGWVPTPRRRLEEALDGWTEDDFMGDRLLLRITNELDPEGKERKDFDEARAKLLEPGGITAKTPPLVEEWRKPVAALTRVSTFERDSVGRKRA